MPTVADICRDARAGKLSQRQLLDWKLMEGGRINERDPNGLTPLCSAVMGGNSSIVRLLIENNARVNEESNHGCTALWFATRLEDRDKAYSIVDILLRKGADVDSFSDTSMLNTTPLMNAMRAGLDMRVMDLLLSKKPALDRPSKKNSANEVAKFLMNKQYMEALKKSGNIFSRAMSGMYIVKSLNSLLTNSFRIVNYFTGNALPRLLGLAGSSGDPSGDSTRGPKPEALAAQRFDPGKFDKEITGHIASVGLNKFYPADSKFLQTVVRKAATLAKSRTTALARPEHLPGLARLSLYQHILFCDNSGSMNTSDRIDSMIEVAKGITEIASYLVPDDEGLRIKFLNTTDTERELYDRYGKVKTASDAAEMVMQARYDGITMLGTVLKRVVLEPYVYQHLNQNQKLEKPLLISIITDGCPFGEDVDKLKRVIIECKQILQEKNYNPGAVNFQIHQIGNDRLAKAFLDDLRTDSEIKKHVFCSSQKLDEKYKELRDNEEELEIWLFKTLAGPLLGS